MLYCKPLYADTTLALLSEPNDTLPLRYLRLFAATTSDYDDHAYAEYPSALGRAKGSDELRPEKKAAVTAQALVRTIKASSAAFLERSDLISGPTVSAGYDSITTRFKCYRFRMSTPW